MRINAISVCVNYSDFFAHCIKVNLETIDKWIVMTDLEDSATVELCAKYAQIQCIQTNIFYEGGVFRKYAAINEAIKYLDKDCWVLFIDSDIVMHSYIKRILESINLDKNKIYGMDRVNCNGWKKWLEFQKNGGLLANNWLLHPAGLEMGARIVHIYGEEGENGKFGGWKPLGYWQLVHSSALSSYPEGSEDASHGDMAFAKLWSRENRELIPELMVVHLSTDNYKGNNWRGRKSKYFGYEEEVSS